MRRIYFGDIFANDFGDVGIIQLNNNNNTRLTVLFVGLPRSAGIPER